MTKNVVISLIYFLVFC